MNTMPLDGDAIVWCEGAYATPNGKTAHGLVRFTRRYHVCAVIDSRWAGRDAGEVLDGAPNGIPVVDSLEAALAAATAAGRRVTHFVVGLAPDGGRLPRAQRTTVVEALRAGLNVDAGLHDFLSEDPELAAIAQKCGAVIRDVRRPPARDDLHFFSGVIESVESTRIALLGTDSAVGKRTTAWLLVRSLESRRRSVEMIGTGQTAWMQGVRYGMILDSIVNDFVSGEIEHAVWRAWTEGAPDFMVLEGQGSLMNPAYPGGFELLAAGRPHGVILQHAPGRVDYDGFPGYRIQPLATQIQAVELIGGVPVVAIAVNHEALDPSSVPDVCARIAEETSLPTVSPLRDGVEALTDVVVRIDARRRETS